MSTSASGKQPYTQRLEKKPKLPWYHAPHICGSSLHGLAQTIQTKLKTGFFDDALAQIKRCIDARSGEMKKYSNLPAVYSAHNKILLQLVHFSSLVIRLQTLVQKGDVSFKKLESTIVRYVEKTEPHHFEIEIGSLEAGSLTLQGGRRRKSHKSHKRIRRGKTRRGKTRRGKTRRGKTRRGKTRRGKTRRGKTH